jgi:hypothetical protein
MAIAVARPQQKTRVNRESGDEPKFAKTRGRTDESCGTSSPFLFAKCRPWCKMPIGRDAAYVIANDYLNSWPVSDADRPVISLQDTEELDIGWVFFWLPQSAIKSGESVGGNSPLLVLKNDGRLHSLGTADHWEISVSRLREQLAR